MSKITLNRIASSYPFTAALNDIIESIETELNTKVMYKTNPIGEDNSLDQDLDLDGHDILNASKIEATNIIVGGIEYLPNLIAYADAAQYYASESELFSVAASDSAAEAAQSAADALAAAGGVAPGAATTLAQGLVTLSDDLTAQSKSGDTVITAGNLAALNATDTMSGLVEKATTAEAIAGTADKYPDAAGVLSEIRGNIIGTVSQSSGVPTGAIIEQGGNANGRYIKYADGTMICTGAITLNLTITTATGSVFVSTAAATVTYPTTFAATPTHFIVSQSASSSAWISATSPSSTTAGTVYLMASTSRAAQGYSATFLAIGRWY